MEHRSEGVGFEVRKLDHILSRNLEMMVKAAEIDQATFMHGWIIRYLYENMNSEIYQKDLERHFSIGRSTVTNIIQLMEKKGYISRESVSSDARLKRVILTRKGVESYEKIEAIINVLNEKMLKGITEDELRIFLQVIHKIEDNMSCKKLCGKKEVFHAENNLEGSKGV